MVKFSGFLRSSLVVMFGAGLGQFITLLATPIITRLFTPSDFGIFSLYLSTISIVSVIASLRLEYAITLVKSNNSAIYLLAACLGISAITAFLTLFVLLFLGHISSWHLSVLGHHPYVEYTALGVLVVSAFQALTYLTIRVQSYGKIAKSKIAQPVGTSVIQILAGYIFASPGALMFGDLFGRVASTIYLVRPSIIHRSHFRIKKFRRLFNILFARYRYFPLVSAPSSLLNVLGLQLPVIFLLSIYGPEIVGLFALIQRIIGAPIALIGQSLSQVYVGEASKFAREDIARIPKLFWNLLKHLIPTALIITVCVAVGGYYLIGPVFGHIWQSAGIYAVALSPMLFGQFVVPPVLQTLTILERQDVQFVWDFLRVLGVVIVFIAAKELQWRAVNIIAVYSVFMFLMYGVGAILTFMVINHEYHKRI